MPAAAFILNPARPATGLLRRPSGTPVATHQEKSLKFGTADKSSYLPWLFVMRAAKRPQPTRQKPPLSPLDITDIMSPFLAAPLPLRPLATSTAPSLPEEGIVWRARAAARQRAGGPPLPALAADLV